MANPILKFKTWILTVTGLVFGENVTFQKQIISTQTPGTAPISSQSLTKCNLNVEQLNGIGITATEAYIPFVSGGNLANSFISQQPTYLDISPVTNLRFGRTTNSASFAVEILKGNNTLTYEHRFLGIGNTYMCADIISKLGIGTSSPLEKLHVVGNILTTGFVSSTGYVKNGSYTTTGRDALTPSAGMVIFNTTLVKFQGYNGAAWNNLD